VAKFAEQPGYFRAVDEVPGEAPVERWQGDGRITHDLHVHATAAEADDRAKHRIPDNADHQFPAIRAAVHLLDRNARYFRLRYFQRDLVDQLSISAPDFRRGIDVELDAA
jgi:hypothetical protein